MREQVRLHGKATSQLRTRRIPGDDEKVRLLRNQTTKTQPAEEMKTNTKKERELLQRKVGPQAGKQSLKKITKVQEMLLKFYSNQKTIIKVKAQAKSKPVEIGNVEETIHSVGR